MKSSPSLRAVFVTVMLLCLMPIATPGGLRAQDAPIPINALTWSPDGSRIAVGRGSPSCSGDDNDVHILDASTGSVVSTLSGHSCEVLSVSWRSGGQQLATTSTDGFIRIWDANTGQLLLSSEELVGRKIAVWSPDGTRLAALRSAYPGVELLDASTLHSQNYLCCDSGVALAVVWSPDSGRLAFASTDQKVYVWDVATGETALVLTGHRDYATRVDWSPDGSKLVSGGGRNDPTVRIWDATTGAELQVLQGHADFVTEAKWSPDGNIIASSSADGTVRVWDAQTGQLLQTIQAGNQVHAVVFSPDGSQLAYGGVGGSVHIVDVPEAAAPDTFSVAWSPDGTQIAAAYDSGIVHIMNATTKQVEYTFDSGGRPSLAWHPTLGNLLAMAGAAQAAQIVDVTTGQAQVTIYTNDTIYDVAWSPDGSHLATAEATPGLGLASKGWVRIWNASSGTLEAELGDYSGWITDVEWSSRNQIAAQLSDNESSVVIIWNAVTGDPLRTLQGERIEFEGQETLTPVYLGAWSPDGSQIATTDVTVQIWNAAGGSPVMTVDGYTGRADVAWSPDGSMLASASLDVQVWSTQTGQLLQTIEAGSRVYVVAWSPDGRQIAYGGDDGSVHIVDVPEVTG